MERPHQSGTRGRIIGARKTFPNRFSGQDSEGSQVGIVESALEATASGVEVAAVPLLQPYRSDAH